MVVIESEQMSRKPSNDGPPVAPTELDFGTLALFVGQASADRVQERLVAKGYDGVRISHGYVIQHLVAGDRSIGDLAERLGVTQQAASKVVAELEALGILEGRIDATDLRRRRIALSERGRALVDEARRARRALEASLARKHGAEALDACKVLLASVLEDLGGGDAVRVRRVRAPH